LSRTREGPRFAFGIAVQSCDPFVAPRPYAIPIHGLAYHTVVIKDTDADQPRNLASRVTVE
jgi:glucosamine--fructose-6-phosphate aminotransferase (isomerizing)